MCEWRVTLSKLQVLLARWWGEILRCLDEDEDESDEAPLPNWSGVSQSTGSVRTQNTSSDPV